jgi:hypothetical protein
MTIIYCEDLTAAERSEIERRHAPYHRFEEFWDGLASYGVAPAAWRYSRDPPRLVARRFRLSEIGREKAA